MSSTNSNTVSVPVKVPATMQPTNESISLIEWAAHQQAQWQRVADSIDNQSWLAEHGYSDVSPDEIFAA